MAKKISIARIVTIPEAFVHITSFLKYLNNNTEVDLTLVSSDGKYRKVLIEAVGKDITPISISRDIELWNDLKSLFALTVFFIKKRFTIVHSSTPKAGIITALAGMWFPQMIRIHTFTGQRWANLSGFKRELLKLIDRLIIKLNTQCYADSQSQIEYLIAEGVAKSGEVLCINRGSYGGIDINRFDNAKYPEARKNLLNEININDDSKIIILFVGRITRDKGIEELISAFQEAYQENQQLELVLVGPYESHIDAISEHTLKQISEDKNIRHLGFKTKPELYFSGADIFCLPSYREGFGTVVLEAAACNLLTIGTRIPGLVDSVVDNETGILVDKKDIKQLKEAILKIANDQTLRLKLSSNARIRARKEFDANYLVQLQWQEYQRLLKMRS
jgi:glycosyltransferase involved in cell wall biosynthesis